MSGSVVRPLPARPDLESERKRAKQLLREVHRGEPEALARIAAQNRSAAAAKPEDLKLADAQLAIAREYGFRSWPLLVSYYRDVKRSRGSVHRRLRKGYPLDDSWIRTIIGEHRDRRHWTALQLGSTVPRFYGLTIDEIFAMDVTEDDARLAIARENGFVDWEELQAKAAEPDERQWRGPNTPLGRMNEAIAHGDLSELQRLVAEYPPLLKLGNPPTTHIGHGIATRHFLDRSATSRAIVDWAGSIGIDPQATLNYRLIGRVPWRMETADVDRLIAEGGNPSWIAPNGYSVLEHAIYRYWNGEAVDALARHVKPRDRFWVAAGLGDVAMLRRHFDRNGKLKTAARDDRPDMLALTSNGSPPMPGADDALILWDAAFAAALNARPTTLDFLLERGFPIDYNFGMSLLSFAVGNALVPMAELLLSRGASLDIRGWRPHHTAREMAIGYQGNREDPAGRRILELCGHDPDQVYRDADARRGPPQLTPPLRWAIAAAHEDARKLGRPETGAENLFVGLLRKSDDMVWPILWQAGVDDDKLRAYYGARLTDPEAASTEVLPFDAEVHDIIQRATADAAKQREGITPWDVLMHTMSAPSPGVRHVIQQVGGDPAKVVERVMALRQRISPRR